MVGTVAFRYQIDAPRGKAAGSVFAFGDVDVIVVKV